MTGPNILKGTALVTWSGEKPFRVPLGGAKWLFFASLDGSELKLVLLGRYVVD